MIQYPRSITATLPLGGSEARRRGGLPPKGIHFRFSSLNSSGSLNCFRPEGGTFPAGGVSHRNLLSFRESPEGDTTFCAALRADCLLISVPVADATGSSCVGLRPKASAIGPRFFHVIVLLLIFVVPAIGFAEHVVADDSPESLAGFSASETYDLVPGLPLDLEEAFFVRSLYRVAKVSSESLGKFSQDNDDVSWQQLVEKSRDFRFWTFTRDALLEKLTVLKFPADSETGIKGVYLATCRWSTGQKFFLVCRSVPSRLPRGKQLKEPIRFSGFFYNSVQLAAGGKGIKLGRADPEEKEKEEPDEIDTGEIAPLFVVNRFAWYPNALTEADGKLSVSAGHVELASQGVDVGLFDYVRRRNSKPLAQQDADCFYQMLWAASAIGREGLDGPQQVDDQASSSVGFVELVGAPGKHIGARVRVTGSLRQCVRIEVPADEPAGGVDQSQRHYYQVSLFPDTGGRKVVTRTGDGEALSFDRYPVTVCLTTLPAEVKPETLAGKTATVDGFFYRLIKYQSQKTEAEGQDGMVSPLVMASDVQLVATASSARAVDNLMNTFLWLMLAAVAGAIIWKFLNWRRSFFSGAEQGTEGAFDLPERIDASNFEDQNLS